jgi:hypothetical protein
MPPETHVPSAAADGVRLELAWVYGRLNLQTATPGQVDTKVTAPWRGGDVHIRAKCKLAVHTKPDKDEDHGPEHLRCWFPDLFAAARIDFISIMIWGWAPTVFLPTGLDVQPRIILDFQKRRRPAKIDRFV